MARTGEVAVRLRRLHFLAVLLNLRSCAGLTVFVSFNRSGERVRRLFLLFCFVLVLLRYVSLWILVVFLLAYVERSRSGVV